MSVRRLLAVACLLASGTAVHAQDHQHMQHMQHAPPVQSTPVPPVTDADRVAARKPDAAHPAHDNTLQSFVLVDRLEAFDGDHSGQQWSARAWMGHDLDKLWVRTEGERTQGRTTASDVEVLYGRAVAPWWDVLVGLRHDFKPGAAQDFLALGVTGMAPYKIEVQATAFAGQGGQFGTRLEFEYEALLTNRLILQPLIEVEAWGHDDPQRGIGSGLSQVEAGLRLRYEVTRQFAPYVGLVREWRFGGTADQLRAEGEPANDTRVVAGIRAWF
jgi:copper resistance protein B